MSSRRDRVRSAAAVALIVVVAGLARAEPPVLPDGPGKAELERTCSQCHSLETVVKVGHTRSQWEAKIDSMISKGAKLSDEDIDAIAEYLALHFGSADAN